MEYHLIAQGTDGDDTLSKALGRIGATKEADRLDVAVAYATLPGIKVIELALGDSISSSRWIIGLDDAITQPEALKYLINKDKTYVRFAKMTPKKRFHPKLYRLWSSTDSARCFSAIGSGNMTLNGLRHNGEVAVILASENEKEANDLCFQWDAMWKLGTPLTAKVIAAYEKQYAQAREHRKALTKAGISPAEPAPNDPVDQESDFNGNPASASMAWLEAGTASAGGRDLEFPRDMMPFFKLQKSPTQKIFEMRPGALHSLTFTERTDNQMWRLLLSRDAIQACVGRDSLRPVAGGNRSDLAIVFYRTAGKSDYRVEMVPIGSGKYAALERLSKSVNGLFSTRNPGGRRYGFF